MISLLACIVWVVAAGSVDIDGDGVADLVRIETRDGVRIRDKEPCGACGVRVEGQFLAIVELSADKRRVITPVYLHDREESLWFWNKPTSILAIADYNGDGRPDFNLGQYTNNTKWEYALFTMHSDGRVEPLAHDKPEIYVSPGDEPSTTSIEAIAGGFRFRDFGNGGEKTGWWTFTCQWQRDRQAFDCTSKPDSL